MAGDKWSPWRMTGAAFDGGIPEISEPPCKECAMFCPIANWGISIKTGTPFVKELRICHAEKMYADFSCFVEKS